MLSNKGLSHHGYGCSSSHVWIWELDSKESWAPKNWCFWTVVLEKTLESPLDCKEIQPVLPKGDQSWVFIGKTDAEAETPILWPPHVKSWLIGKDLDAGKDWRREEKGTTEDEMAGWHHWLNGHEFEHILRVGDGQGGLACCGPWCCKESDTTEWLNWTELYWRRFLRVLCTARSSTQSALKEINPEYSLEGLMLKLQYSGHLTWRANSLEKTLMLGKTESKRRRG